MSLHYATLHYTNGCLQRHMFFCIPLHFHFEVFSDFFEFFLVFLLSAGQDS